MQIKVADFGLTRDVYSSDYYRASHNAKLPVKWMPPETLNDAISNEKTDVVSKNYARMEEGGGGGFFLQISIRPLFGDLKFLIHRPHLFSTSTRFAIAPLFETAHRKYTLTFPFDLFFGFAELASYMVFCKSRQRTFDDMENKLCRAP